MRNGKSAPKRLIHADEIEVRPLEAQASRLVNEFKSGRKLDRDDRAPAVMRIRKTGLYGDGATQSALAD